MLIVWFVNAPELIVMAPLVNVKAPPLKVSGVALVVEVLVTVLELASRVPPEIVDCEEIFVLDARVTVPPDTLRVVKVSSPASRVMVPVAAKVYEDEPTVPSVKVELAVDVFQFPRTVHAPVVTVSVPMVVTK